MRPLLAALAALLVVAAPATAAEWLSGDLHIHTTYSHDSWGGFDDDNTGPEEFYTLGNTVEEVFTVASARGLDFLVISDHNDVRAQSDPGFGAGGVLGIPAYENSLQGHGQMLGARRIYDKANVRAMQEELRRDGGYLQANHPIDAEGKPDWQYPYEQVPVATVEVWNLPWFYQPPFPSATGHDADLDYWQGLLDRGAHVGATGGSDTHWKATIAGQGPGQPTTWVHAEDRSVQAILDAIGAGRTAISWQPPALGGPRIFLEGKVGGAWSAMPGDTIDSKTPLRVRVQGAVGTTLEIRFDSSIGEILVPVTSTDFTHELTAPAGATYAFAMAYYEDGKEERPGVCEAIPVLDLHGQTTYCKNRIGMAALSSAIYFQAARLPRLP